MSNGWDQLHSAIQALAREIRQVAPDAATADEGEAYVARVLTACLNDCFPAACRAWASAVWRSTARFSENTSPDPIDTRNQ